jgi:hypothetical protein
MPASLDDGALELAIVEGALAISIADGSFGQEEWELFASTMSRLKLSDPQHQAIHHEYSPDLRAVASSLATLQDPSHRLEIARSFCLFAAADAAENAQELGTLRTLLQALGHSELEQGLPALYRSFRRSESWWQRLCGDLGEWLARWASPHRRR